MGIFYLQQSSWFILSITYFKFAYYFSWLFCWEILLRNIENSIKPIPQRLLPLYILTPQILAAIDHITDHIRHKRPDLDTIFDYIYKANGSNIDKGTIKVLIMQLLKQKSIPKLKDWQWLEVIAIYSFTKLYTKFILLISSMHVVSGPIKVNFRKLLTSAIFVVVLF